VLVLRRSANAVSRRQLGRSQWTHCIPHGVAYEMPQSHADTHRLAYCSENFRMTSRFFEDAGCSSPANDIAGFPSAVPSCANRSVHQHASTAPTFGCSDAHSLGSASPMELRASCLCRPQRAAGQMQRRHHFCNSFGDPLAIAAVHQTKCIDSAGDEVDLDLFRPLGAGSFLLPEHSAQKKPPALDAAYSARLHALVKFASIVEIRTAGIMAPAPVLTCRAECHA